MNHWQTLVDAVVTICTVVTSNIHQCSLIALGGDSGVNITSTEVNCMIFKIKTVKVNNDVCTFLMFVCRSLKSKY